MLRADPVLPSHSSPCIAPVHPRQAALARSNIKVVRAEPALPQGKYVAQDDLGLAMPAVHNGGSTAWGHCRKFLVRSELAWMLQVEPGIGYHIPS